jgi:HD-GYP domain-containing protein (c-di-GMP phosphodiesterase class II)
MLKLPVHILQPGMVLAQAITDDRGRTLLRDGIALTDEYIEVLRQRGLANAYVVTDSDEKLGFDDRLPLMALQLTQSHVEQVFEFVRCLKKEIVAEGTPQDNVEQEPEVADKLQTTPDFDMLEKSVSTLVNEMLNKRTLTSLTQIHHCSLSQFNHAVRVATVGLLIGHSLHLSLEDLNRLGVGCLLHDIGKVFFGSTTFSLNGQPPTADRLKKIKDHPRLGYELLRSHAPDAVIVNHVALEHHERQDGKGYPRNLRGTNSIQRPRFDRETILLASEITTVADVYDILSRPNGQRPALTPAQIAATMRRFSGTVLNRELVEIFIAMLPVMPPGLHIVARTGRYSGYSGVVVSPNPSAPDRPNIRLSYNPRGERIPAIELNLASQPNILVEATF